MASWALRTPLDVHEGVDGVAVDDYFQHGPDVTASNAHSMR
jgi:hypothetical protein